MKMLNTELLITYGFEKILSTPLEKWCFEKITLYVETFGDQTIFRITVVDTPPVTLYIRSEEDLQCILKTIDEGGSLSSLIPKLSRCDDKGLLDEEALTDLIKSRKN